MKALLAFVVFAIALLAAPAPAYAHAGGLTATDSRSRVVAVTPAVPGLRVATIENGARIRLVNGTGSSVVPGAGGGPAVPAAIAPGKDVTWIDTRVTPDGRRIAAGQSVDWTMPLDVGGTTVLVSGVLTGEQPPIPLVWWVSAVLVAAAVILAARRLTRGDVLLCSAGLVAAGASIAHVAGSTLAVESAPPAGRSSVPPGSTCSPGR